MQIYLVIASLIALITYLAYESGKYKSKIDRLEKQAEELNEASKIIDSLNDDNTRNELREKMFRD